MKYAQKLGSFSLMMKYINHSILLDDILGEAMKSYQNFKLHDF